MSQADLTRNVGRVRAGESDAWGQLYEELAPSVFRLCRRVLPTREDAEDATTEIFLKVRDRVFKQRELFLETAKRRQIFECGLRGKASRITGTCGDFSRGC